MDGFPNFKDYVNYTRRRGSWGDHLTLTAISHWMLRPIRVITDSPSSPVMFATPPDFIAESAWGPKLILVRHGEVHYEATSPVASAASAPESGVAVSSPKVSSSTYVPYKGDPRLDPVRVMQSAFHDLGEQSATKFVPTQ